MSLLAFLTLLAVGRTVTGETHSLHYIYTALSKHVDLPGIHDFTAMGLMDNRMIDYFDSTTKEKVPKQDWMSENMADDYWEKGTKSRQSKQEWFKVNIKILMERLKQNDTDVHVLQWMHGCKGTKQPNGKIDFIAGIDMYSYDGELFLSFDDAHQVWVAGSPAAEPTKRTWDGVKVLREYTKGYLENECIDWLTKFTKFGKSQLEEAIPPEVHIFAKNSNTGSTVVLTCLATGFLPKDITLRIRRNGRVLETSDGLKSWGVRPNGDGTHQQRDSVEILRSDKSDYTCEVHHPASGLHVVEKWNQVLPEEKSGLIGGVVGALVLVIAVIAIGVGLVLYRRKKGKADTDSKASKASLNGSDSGVSSGSGGTGNNGQNPSSSSSSSSPTPPADAAEGSNESISLLGVPVPQGTGNNGQNPSSSAATAAAADGSEINSLLTVIPVA